ncbi:MAG: PIN domain-containing protein [Sneathiellaceae bacterium]
MEPPLVVLDTNVFVAAGFNPRSSSAALVGLVRAGRLCLAWDEATRAETRHVLDRIPPLGWAAVTALFEAGRRFEAMAGQHGFAEIGDPSDRKFAALAQRADAPLISSDSDLLSVRHLLQVRIHSPSEGLDLFAALLDPARPDDR